MQDYIDDGRLRERPDGTRNPLQTVPLLDAIPSGKHDAVFGGGRRDEERARAKERVFSMRDEFGQWDPRNQRPELWSLYNGRHLPGEHVRVFPLSNWTELDVWDYIEAEKIALPIDLLRPRAARSRSGTACGSRSPPVTPVREDRRGRATSVRYRTVGDMSCTAAVLSDATTVARRDHRGRAEPAHRTRRDPRRRPAVARPRWKTASERATSDGAHLAATSRGSPARTGRRTLLRLATAGSVDDGKSTLVGRLLFDTNSVLTDTLDSRREGQPAQGSGPRRPRSAHRRSARRARAGHHHRRGVPLLRHPGTQVHPGRLPGTRAVHPQHRHRLVDRRRASCCWSTPATAWSSRPGGTSPSPSLLRVPHVILVVNKIDLVDFSEDVFNRIATDFALLARSLGVGRHATASRCRPPRATTW